MPEHSEQYRKFLETQNIAMGDIDEDDIPTEEVPRPAAKIYKKETVEVDMPVPEAAKVIGDIGGAQFGSGLETSETIEETKPSRKQPEALEKAGEIERQKAIAEVHGRLADENAQDVLADLLDERQAQTESQLESGGIHGETVKIDRLNIQIAEVEKAIRQAA